MRKLHPYQPTPEGFHKKGATKRFIPRGNYATPRVVYMTDVEYSIYHQRLQIKRLQNRIKQLEK